MGIMKPGVSSKEEKSRPERMEQIIKRTFRGREKSCKSHFLCFRIQFFSSNWAKQQLRKLGWLTFPHISYEPSLNFRDTFTAKRFLHSVHESVKLNSTCTLSTISYTEGYIVQNLGFRNCIRNKNIDWTLRVKSRRTHR